ncbi:osmoprotectant NAGGN system M42 family peptidase [Desulfosarcina widdelii]|uniref:osmoprotectant NAGGN system M42 family peptidase n=1 Tax=Desulfosarcina widdelii TaxID=947919 RepID=UPI0012D33CF9|nr:osmoprotectant NAGGN system M42 family peptidase [Desulfosarcina widdelii]
MEKKPVTRVPIDSHYLKHILVALLNIPSPSGYTDQIVHFVGQELQKLGIAHNVTRRGAIRATLKGRMRDTLDRAVTVHLDTLGAMVRRVKPNGRLAIASVGTWSSRFAEGGRVTIYADSGPIRGTVLPLKSSGHAYGEAVDTQPAGWDHVELRVDDEGQQPGETIKTDIQVGDFVAFDALPEISDAGFINARHLDDKAGVAILLTVAKALKEEKIDIPIDCHLIFTIFEEVGSGASAAVYGDVTEMVVIDHAPVAPNQNATEFHAVVCMMDQTGPFDYHLSRKLLALGRENGIDLIKDVFRFYRSDSASAIEAGNDTRTALLGFGLDGSHGYERTHLSSLIAVADLIALYVQSAPTFSRDKDTLASLNGFPHQPDREVIQIET